MNTQYNIKIINAEDEFEIRMNLIVYLTTAQCMRKTDYNFTYDKQYQEFNHPVF